MIRPLRQWHRRAMCALCVLLPIAFAGAIALRRPSPIAGSIPQTLEPREPGKMIRTETDLWPGLRVITVLREEAAGGLGLELLYRDLVKPDLLIYWSAGAEAPHAQLPGTARLLGSITDRASVPLPAGLRGQEGRLLLYSLAEHELVAVSNPLHLPPRP